MNLEEKIRRQKFEQIINRQVEGEGFISTPPRVWKGILIKNFNKVQRKEITIYQLLDKLKEEGVVFLQKDSLVKYPVIEYLKHITKVSKKDIDLK